MKYNLGSTYEIKTPEEIEEFIDNNEDTLKILDAITPQVTKHFPNTKLSLETCSKLGWTTGEKILLNVQCDEKMFFNGMLDHFNEIYKEIEPVIEDIENTVVLFPEMTTEILNEDRLNNNNAINLLVRTAYFNNYNDGIIQREMDPRDIPKQQQIEEILDYCRNHENPNISDIVFDLQLDLFDVDSIIDELAEDGIYLNVKY